MFQLPYLLHKKATRRWLLSEYQDVTNLNTWLCCGFSPPVVGTGALIADGVADGLGITGVYDEL